MRFITILTAAVVPFMATAAPIKPRVDTAATVAVLKFAEVLEQLETQFYTQALQKFVAQDFTNAGISVPDVAIQNFQDIMSHEASHVAVLDQALSDNGDSPIGGCSFNFDAVLTDVATMASVARVVELVGVAAYLGGADILDDPNFLAAAATILTVEARHQTFLNIIAGATPIPQAFDVALHPQDVLSIAGAFVSGCDIAGELGLPAANPPLAITNTGVIGAGTQLQFSSPALNSTNQDSASCQMLVGGQALAIVFPVNQCVVPDGIDGPVMIYLTTDSQPLAMDIHIRATTQILAGPTAAFLDSKSNALGALVRNNGSGFSASQTISPSQAQDQLISASTFAPTETASATGATSAAETTSATDAAPTNTEGNIQVTEAPTLATTAAVPVVSVIGVGQVPASA